jgi:3-oxoacyl-[acyl-carrier-protein] synthase-1
VVCGATEEECWFEVGPYFDNLGLMPTDYNDTPEQACRPYDVGRQGLVMTAGAGILVLESLQHAQQRGAEIHAEVVGYGSQNDGDNLYHPTGDGLSRALRDALAEAAGHGVRRVDYVNTHGTGTGVGDVIETSVLRTLLGDGPFVSSTKSLTGHGLGAAGAIEAVLTLLMLSEGFVAPTLNLETIDAECGGLRHVQRLIETDLDAVMSFSVGLGGTNSALVWRAFRD